MNCERKILTYADLAPLRGYPTTLTCGIFDCLHVGHVEHLEFCSAYAPGSLAVCVGTDSTVRMLKGPGRPVIGQDHRARMLAALECVDLVIVSEESGRFNFTRLMELLKPVRLVVTADDPARRGKLALCERMGVEMVIDDTRPIHGPSTTRIVTQVLAGAQR